MIYKQNEGSDKDTFMIILMKVFLNLIISLEELKLFLLLSPTV